MPFNDPKEVFVQILSSVRQGTEQTTKIFQEISQVTQHPDIREAMEAPMFVSDTILGEEPVKLSGRLHVRMQSRLAALARQGKASTDHSTTNMDHLVCQWTTTHGSLHRADRE